MDDEGITVQGRADHWDPAGVGGRLRDELLPSRECGREKEKGEVMGLLDLFAAGYLAKRAINKLNPPIVTAPAGYEVIGLESRGMSEYKIKYRKIGDRFTTFMIISRTTHRYSVGASTFEFHWS